jgi:hypothetical protein
MFQGGSIIARRKGENGIVRLVYSYEMMRASDELLKSRPDQSCGAHRADLWRMELEGLSHLSGWSVNPFSESSTASQGLQITPATQATIANQDQTPETRLLVPVHIKPTGKS